MPRIDQGDAAILEVPHIAGWQCGAMRSTSVEVIASISHNKSLRHSGPLFMQAVSAVEMRRE